MFIWSVLTYSCESRTLEKVDSDKLEGTEMWRRIMKTSWIDRENEDI